MKKRAAVGIDVGGTKTLCVLVDTECNPLAHVKFKTAPDEGRGRFTRNLLAAIRSLNTQAQAKQLKITAIGIGCAGLVDEKGIRIKTSPNLLCLEDYPIGKHLRRVLRTELTIGNDVQLGVYAEHQLGAARGCRHVLGVFFGTGVGGAAIIDKKIYAGASGMGGQVGCLLAQPVGGPKAALSHGILDRIASKAAIAGEALVMAVKDWAPYLHRKVGTDLSKVTWGVLRRAIEHGDERVEEMLRARMRVVGIALSNAVNFLNPDMLVLGGGLVNEMPKLVLEEVEGGLREYLVPEVGDALKVRAARLENAVALGAAHQALKQADIPK
jgi:glucokinase